MEYSISFVTKFTLGVAISRLSLAVFHFLDFYLLKFDDISHFSRFRLCLFPLEFEFQLRISGKNKNH